MRARVSAGIWVVSGRFVVSMTRGSFMTMRFLALLRMVWFVSACCSSGNVGRVM